MACGFRLRRGRSLADGVRVSLAKGPQLKWVLHGGATNSLTIYSELRAPKIWRRLRCGLFYWDETVRAFPKWGAVAWACRAAIGMPATGNLLRPSMLSSRPASRCWIPANFMKRREING